MLDVLAELAPTYSDPIPELPAHEGGVTVDAGDSAERLVSAAQHVVCCPAYSGATTPRGCLPPRLRSGALDRLVLAQKALPTPFELVLLDGWRSRRFQEDLGAHYGREAVEADFVADARDEDVVPPHVTGGAVDVTIGLNGCPLGLGSAFDEFTSRAYLTALESGLPSPERLLRRMLYRALVDHGFAPYALEWWHFSYGDQNWARFHGSERALYGETES